MRYSSVHRTHISSLTWIHLFAFSFAITPLGIITFVFIYPSMSRIEIIIMSTITNYCFNLSRHLLAISLSAFHEFVASTPLGYTLQ